MKFGVLADHFEGAGAKYLTEVEVNKLKSNQHEFQGIGTFRRFLGESAEKKSFDTTYYWLDDESNSEPLSFESYSTWSDVRRNNPERAAEYHLYYSAEAEPIVHKAKVGDLLFIAKTRQGVLKIIVCPAETTISRQLLWLFGLDLDNQRTDALALEGCRGIHLGYAALSVLDDLGIELDSPEPNAFEVLIDNYGDAFPSTLEFSSFARKTFGEADPFVHPDETLVAWMDHEELLFRSLERHIVSDRLSKGFVGQDGADVDGFLSFSLSVQNRRKSRAGFAFGHHLEAILSAHDLAFKREATTEKRNGPDFLFPGEAEYHDPSFNSALLTMLGAKTSCKDRWRQVLAEANRISEKHLLTLQPGISETQTAEMQAERLQLVVPRPIHSSYLKSQQQWIMDLARFIELVKARKLK